MRMDSGKRIPNSFLASVGAGAVLTLLPQIGARAETLCVEALSRTKLTHPAQNHLSPAPARYPQVHHVGSFFSYDTIEAVWSYGRELPRSESRLQTATSLALTDLGQDPRLGGLTTDVVRGFVRRAAALRFHRHEDLPHEVEAALEFERYRLLLHNEGFNPEERPPSFEALLRQLGFSSLSHSTEIANLPRILIEGLLRSKRSAELTGAKVIGLGGPHNNSDFIYLEVLNHALAHVRLSTETRHSTDYERVPKTLKINPRRAVLELHPRLLDEVRWRHLNVHWQYGAYDPAFSIDPSHLLAAFFSLQANTKSWQTWTKWHFRNEILVEEDIPLAGQIRAIHVAPEEIANVRQLLTAEGVPQHLIELVQ